MAIERKWAPRSLTFLVWLAVIIVGTYLTYRDYGWFVKAVGLGKYALAIAAVFNLVLRFNTWVPIGESGKKFWSSRTVRLNALVLVVCVANFAYAAYAGKNIIVPLLGAFVAYWTIWLRVNRTKTRITFLPGPLGRFV